TEPSRNFICTYEVLWHLGYPGPYIHIDGVVLQDGGRLTLKALCEGSRSGNDVLSSVSIRFKSQLAVPQCPIGHHHGQRSQVGTEHLFSATNRTLVYVGLLGKYSQLSLEPNTKSSLSSRKAT
ncbi:hypothetical protein T310_9968, partial [Rasamsonia emersonii CBS 393.64]